MKSAVRALMVIELLTRYPQGLTFAEIVQHLDLPKSSAHALLGTMADRGHIDFDEATRRHRLGLRIWEAGRACADVFDLPGLAQPYLEAARDALNETVQLAVLEGLENVYVAKVEADQRLVLASRVGMRLPAHATGLGKVLLAGLPEEELAQRLKGVRLRPFTARTVTSRRALRAELEQIRAQGFGRDVGEYTEGVRCVAVPVPDEHGQIAAAMSVSVPEVRFGDELEQRFIEVLRAQARELSGALGYQRPAYRRPG